MTETLPDPPELDPAALAGSGFNRARKGFEPTEVHAALGRAADALRTWQLRDAQMRVRLDELEQRLSESQELDEDRLTAVLGEETSRIVAAARDAAAEIRSKAEERAARLLRETEEEATGAAEALKSEATSLRDEAARLRDDAASEATTIRTEAESGAAMTLSDAQARSEELITAAESLLGTRTAEADEVVARMTAAAEAELATAVDAASAVRAAAEADALAEIERAREEGRAMVAEAKALRERMLRDLADRRRTARRQIEGALAGRDRVIEVLREAGQQLTATVDGLDEIDNEASIAAEAAAAGIDENVDAELAALHAELGDPDIVEVTDDVEVVSVETVDTVEVVESGDSVEVVETVDTVEVVESGDSVEVIETVETIDVVETGDSLDVTETVEVETVVVRVEPDADAGDDANDAAESELDAEVIGIFEAADRAEAPSVDEDLLDDDDQDDADEDSDDAGGEGAEGATVHDLFARIRAEGLDEDGNATDLSESADGAEGDEIDLTAAGSSGVGGGSATASAAATGNGTTPSDGAEPLSSGTDTAVVSAERELLDNRDELLTPVEKSLSRALKRLASDEQNEMLDRLRRVKRGRPDLADILPSSDGEDVDRYVEALLPEFNRAVDTGAAFWADVAGSSSGSLFGEDSLAEECLRVRVREFLSVHRAHLERTFGDADEAGLDVSELSDRVRASYRDWRSTSLADLAGDLATAGFTHGERRAAGPGTPWQWVVDNGGLPCADGEDNALAGAVPCEEPFPTGDVTPPAHPGCRCILAPAHL